MSGRLEVYVDWWIVWISVWKIEWGLLNNVEAASSIGEGAHGKHCIVFAVFLVISRYLLLATLGNAWSWDERALGLPHMTVLVRSAFARQHVLQRVCCSPLVEMLLFIPAGWKRKQLNYSVVCDVTQYLWGPSSMAFEQLLISDGSLGLWHSWMLSPVDHTHSQVQNRTQISVISVL